MTIESESAAVHHLVVQFVQPPSITLIVPVV
jgi:hypothetical protein